MTAAARVGLTVLLLAAAAPSRARIQRLPRQVGEFRSIPGVQELSGRVVCRRKQEKDLVQALEKEGKGRSDVFMLRKKSEDEIWKHKVMDVDEDIDAYAIEVPDGVDAKGKRWDENSLITDLMSRERNDLFEYCEPDWLLYPACSNNDDAVYQWHHDAVNSCGAWDIPVTGRDSNITVAIVDYGVDFNHPDLKANRVSPGWNEVNRCWEGGNCAVDDISDSGHGTNVAGIAAAVGNNGIGVSGMGWGVKFRPWRIDNNGGGIFSIRVTRAVTRAADLGDKVINVSFSGINSESVRAAATYAKSKGSLVVWAAGNYNDYHDWGDRDADDIIAVGAVGKDGTSRWTSSPKGSAYGPSVDLFAPGTFIATTDKGGGYVSTRSGTSFSAPVVAGIIALMWSANPSLSPDEVEEKLKNSCMNLGSDGGVDDMYGYGLVNSYEAVLAAKGGLGKDVPIDSQTSMPSDDPTPQPTDQPTTDPSDGPTLQPTKNPSENPTSRPSNGPTPQPTEEPTEITTSRPSAAPTQQPMQDLTEELTSPPSGSPTPQPAGDNIFQQPTPRPTEKPSSWQKDGLTLQPTGEPTAKPLPFDGPTPQPMEYPTEDPTSGPSNAPLSYSTEMPSFRSFAHLESVASVSSSGCHPLNDMIDQIFYLLPSLMLCFTF